MKQPKSMTKPQWFWLGLFLVGALLMILHTLLSLIGLDGRTDIFPLGLALVVVALVPLYTSESARKREELETEMVQILRDIRESLNSSASPRDSDK